MADPAWERAYLARCDEECVSWNQISDVLSVKPTKIVDVLVYRLSYIGMDPD